jgi:DNA (cytosine-5)-methyltransferase 1
MKVLSLFSGIGGFDLGLERAGMEVVGQCEIDPFCNKVLAAHWPEVPNYGDVRDIGSGLIQRGDYGGHSDDAAGSDSVPRLGAVDLVCGGFPCQDLSVAGKRAGLDGARSGLWFEFQRILQELRPSWAIIENVPGLLSSNQGRDFAVLLDGLGECGFGGIAWAVLDSQHFGVPQRRRRVYVICGPSRRSVEQVLSLCEGCEGNLATSRTSGEDVASTIRGRSSSPGVNEPGRGGEDDSNLIVAGALRARDWKGLGFEAEECLVVANPLPGHHPRHDLDNDTYVTHSLRAEGFDASEDGILPLKDGTPLVAIRTANTGANGHGIAEDVAHTLDGANGQAIAGAAVRRLTPVECERLQGFPDGWTQLDDKTPDGPRYKALGNAVSVPVIEYIGRRILAVM